jgi:hypothetical protein
MRTDAERADRRREVRQAARGWHAAGALDAAGLAAVEELYPDDRHRLGPSFRGLAFVFTALALTALWLFVLALAGWDYGFAGTWALVYGAGLAVLTDVQLGPLRREEAGAETATGLASVAFLLGGLGWLLDHVLKTGGRSSAVALCAAAAVFFGTAAARWGGPVHTLFASLGFYAFLSQLPAARGLFVVAAVAMAPLAFKGAEAASLAPSHRRSCEVALAVSLLALYVAVHIGSWDGRWLESIAGTAPFGDPQAGPRLPFILATAALPLGVLAFGVRRRRRLLIHLGALLGVASLVTLRFYVHVAPLSVVLTASGVAALALGLGLRRFLASGRAGERGGFTAEPLFEDRAKRHVLEATASIAAVAPAGVHAAAPGAPSSFAGGGGASGGGGATDGF